MKFEYMLIDLLSMGKLKLDAEFNKLGQEGWELVQIDNTIAYFKRPDNTDDKKKLLQENK